MSNVKKAAIEYAIERVPESAKFKEQIIVGNHLREEIHDSFIRGYEQCQTEYEEKLRWTHVFEKLPDLNSVIELKSEDKRFLGIVKLKNYQGENRYYVQGMYQATGDIDILYNFSHWRKAIL